MSVRRDALARAVDSVVDGTADPDWGLINIELDDERDRDLVDKIRLISCISRVQREEARDLDEATLRLGARRILRRLPMPDGTIEIREEISEDEDEAAPAGSSTRSMEIVPPSVSRWGRHELAERIGHGAFGEVYRATDLQLQREVAIKLLYRGSPKSAERMLHEARTLARVRHSNVVVVHDAEERDGRVGICMEYIRGRTLADSISAHGAFSAKEAAMIGQDLCRALAAVHGAGLVHRDIKAQNVMREEGGRVVLMDFGAGQALGDAPRPRRIIGTPAYIAPEVLEGSAVSPRSDIYSLGVLLYHLVTGDYPVQERTPTRLIEAHRQGRVRRLREAAPGLPAWFVRVVDRAIARNPEDRFASVGELEAALNHRPRIAIRPLLSIAAVALTAAAALWLTWPLMRGPASPHPLVALLPLEAGLGVDADHAAAITEEIYQGLATVDTLRVVASFSAAKAKREQATMPAIAGALRAAAVVDGSVSEAADGYLINLRLFRAGGNAPEWARSFQIAKAGGGTLRRDTALSITNALAIDVSPRVLAQLSRSPAVGTQAFDAYARGRMLLERSGPGDSEAAMAAFESTIKLDPAFAPAHAALARTYHDAAIGGHTSWLAHMERSRTEANNALALDPTLAEAHVMLGQAAFHVDWDWDGAARAYQKAIALNPSDDYARQCYSHFLAARGRLAEARQELEDGRRVNPLSETTDIELVPILQYERRFAEAEALTRSVLVRPFQVSTQLGRIYAFTGRYDEAIEQFEQLRASRIGNHPYIDAEIASAHAGAGRIAEAEAILDRMHERSRSEEIAPELFALVYARLGRADDAFHHLDAAVAAKSARILWMKVDPRWDPLRADPRFGALIRRLGL